MLKFQHTADLFREHIVDVQAEPLYLVSHNEAPDMLHWAASGVTSFVLCWALRPLLRLHGVWQGPGFAAVIRDCDSCDPLAVAIHEIAHGLQIPLRSRGDESSFAAREQECELGMQRFWRAAAGVLECHIEDEKRPMWQVGGNHDLSFIRTCCHLQHRMTEAGWHASPHNIYRSDVYGVTSIYVYHNAFASECHEHEDKPIREILTTAMPQAAEILWRYDTNGENHD